MQFNHHTVQVPKTTKPTKFSEKSITPSGKSDYPEGLLQTVRKSGTARGTPPAYTRERGVLLHAELTQLERASSEHRELQRLSVVANRERYKGHKNFKNLKR